MKRTITDNVAAARRILRGETATPEEIFDLSTALKKENEFGYSRKLLGRALDDATIHAKPALQLKISQEYALCTYKDADLPVLARLNRALVILDRADLLVGTKNQETLGLAGAIWKRKWEVENQKTNLERSLSYYHRGYRFGIDNDNGYTAINAAFVLDCLAALEMSEALHAGTTSATAAARVNEAKTIRREIVASLEKQLAANPALGSQWWFVVTVAQAYFGLADFAKASEWLMKATALDSVEEWQYESTARQFAQLASLQEQLTGGALDAVAEAWQTLSQFLGNNAAALRTLDIGKFGLALSGGGFRASLFHIGMLARLAELDLLRHVEVISCVSGGSIIGAHYYLELRRLLESKADRDITQQDYVELVQRVERDFLAGVQRNIRMRVAADWLANVKMLFVPHYSRTQRVGELFEKEIFARVQGNTPDKPIWLNELFIQPKDAPPNFHPKYHNWKREAKVPMLILNATALNSGHTWQFTASWMGEPPMEIDEEIDSNKRLRRMYYHEAPEKYRRFRLGHAVAASACVPGLFEPLALPNLYEDVTVRLVDGGVHDNQGTGSLKEQDCTVMVVSDASGQMDYQE
ncbi:MAG: patatin-like phospholipase family protein, partial [Ignavibacteriae bacterium]|nr:patatin-like phospholipase family protein [Ignavibacteriota bacterium]